MKESFFPDINIDVIGTPAGGSDYGLTDISRLRSRYAGRKNEKDR
jgi:hypothetical protein